jgi:hypothetical protein
MTKDTDQKEHPNADKKVAGLRRLRLLVWALYYQTPLDVEIGEDIERSVAKRCKLSWERYSDLKQTYPEFWQKAAASRLRAKAAGGFKPQPAGLRRYRKVEAKKKRVLRKPRSRFCDWAARKLIHKRTYKRKWLRDRITNRLFNRLVGL